MGRRPPPSFIKFIAGHVSNYRKLKIPGEFVKRHSEVLPKNCTLRLASSHNLTWRVKTKQIANSLFLKKGWRAFFEDNSLEFGDCLRFKYVGDSLFDVEIYDQSCCYKNLLVTSDHSSDTATEDPSPPRKEEMEPKTETKAVEDPEELMSMSRFPSFKVVMKPAYVRTGAYLFVPRKFANNHMKSARDIELRISNKTYITRFKTKPTRITSGWSKIAKENSLQPGDVCVFQLIDKEDCVLKITIFRHKIIAAGPASSRCSEEIKKKAGKALVAANKLLSTSNHLSFSVVIRPAYLENYYLHVPPKFIRNLHMRGSHNARLQFSGEEWNVVLRISENFARISKGWSNFAKENSIEVGDICVMELTNKKNLVFKVSIFR